MTKKVIPAIQRKWPQCHRNMTVKVQHDNAKAHLIYNHTPEIVAAFSKDPLDMTLVHQPANSPDLNVLDLGYLNSLQTLQYRKRSNTTGELIKAVYESWDELPKEKLNKVFLTLQKIHELVVLHNGKNDYKLPHLRKDALERQGQLPRYWPVSDELRAKIEQLQQPQQAAQAATSDIQGVDI